MIEREAMSTMILAAHGSRRESANNEFRELVGRVARRLNHQFVKVTPAFLEVGSPSIPEAIAQHVDAGSSDIRVLPYFLSCGAHVIRDIPQLIDQQRRRYVGTRIEVLPYLGASPRLVDVLVELGSNVSESDKNETSAHRTGLIYI